MELTGRIFILGEQQDSREPLENQEEWEGKFWRGRALYVYLYCIQYAYNNLHIVKIIPRQKLLGLVCSVNFITVLACDPPCLTVILGGCCFFIYIVFQHVCLFKQNPRSIAINFIPPKTFLHIFLWKTSINLQSKRPFSTATAKHRLETTTAITA